MNSEGDGVPQEASDSDSVAVLASRLLPEARTAGAVTIERAQGPYLWDRRGDRYVDHVMAEGSVVVGHSDPRVNLAVASTAAEVDMCCVGPEYGEVELAGQITQFVPSAEKVAFMAVAEQTLAAAVGIARRATGRHEVALLGEWPVADSVVDRSVIIGWEGEGGPALDFLDEETSTLAALMVRPPVHRDRVSVGRLLELFREWTLRSGALFVLDESMTAFRHHMGGFQEIFGVEPDLTLLGGGMGNGYTVAALTGPGDLVDLMDESVGWPNPYGMAAALETLSILGRGGLDEMCRVGERLRQGLRELAAYTGVVPVTVRGSGPDWTLELDGQHSSKAATGFRQSMAEAGVLLSRVGVNHLSVAHCDEEVAETIQAARWSLRRLASL